MKNLLSLFKFFFIIGLTSFGGYMALVAMVRDRFVEKQKLIDDQIIAEGLMLASILPGPIAVNVVSYVGNYLAGFLGALTSVIAVLLPSFFLVILLSILYFNYGHLFDFHNILGGILPVVIAVILSVGISMGKKAIKGYTDFFIAFSSLLIVLYFDSYVAIITVILVSLFLGIVRTGKPKSETSSPITNRDWQVLFLTTCSIIAVVFLFYEFLPDSLLSMVFLKFSSVSLTLFGGGYVMVPILQNMLVDQLNWVTNEEFVYGISIGQVTPGPILISSVFFGYKIGGIAGAILATIGIFVPSAFLMILVSKIYLQFNLKNIFQPAFQTVRPAIVGLVIYSAVKICLTTVPLQSILLTLIIAVVSLVALVRFNALPAVLIILGGVVGIFIQ